MRPLILIPTYNEAQSLPVLMEALSTLRPAIQSTFPFEVLVVDDHSPDGTGAIAGLYAQKWDWVHLLERPHKQGLGVAYLAAMQWGLASARNFTHFVQMDADFSHHPKYLPIIFESLSSGNDAVFGSRYVPGGGVLNWGFGRRLLSWGGSFYARSVLGLAIRDFTGGFNGWSRAALLSLGLETIQSDGYSFQIELKAKAAQKGLRWVEIPIQFEDRRVGRSKMNRRVILEALLRVWTFRVETRHAQRLN